MNEVVNQEYQRLISSAPLGAQNLLSKYKPFLSSIEILKLTEVEKDLLNKIIEGLLISAYMEGMTDTARDIAGKIIASV